MGAHMNRLLVVASSSPTPSVTPSSSPSPAAVGNIAGVARIADGVGGLPSNSLSNFGKLGTYVGDMGDLDGDGVHEVAVGYHFYDLPITNAGAVWVFFLHRNGTVREYREIRCGNGLSCTGGNNDQLGAEPSRLDQPNGEEGHLPRMVVGQPNYDDGQSNSGRVFVLRMSPNATVLHQAAIHNGAGGLPSGTLGANFQLGSGITTQVQDIDGDGLNDMAVGVPQANLGGSLNGGVFVLFMHGNDTVREHVVLSQAPGMGLDTVVPAITQVGGSLTALPPRDPVSNPVDLVVGVKHSDSILLVPLAANGSVGGTIVVIKGNSGGLPVSGGVPSGSFTGEFGTTVSNPGDMDGDGIEDLLVGSPFYQSFDGAAYILYMNDDPAVDPVRDLRRFVWSHLMGEAASGNPIGAGTGIGDVNGDGRNDLILTQPFHDTGGNDRGAIFVTFMGGVPPSPSPSAAPAAAGVPVWVQKIASGVGGLPDGVLADDDKMGESLSSIGDLDGDGVQDIAVFIVGDDDSQSNSGSFVIMFLHRNGTVKAHQKISALEGGLDFSPTVSD